MLSVKVSTKIVTLRGKHICIFQNPIKIFFKTVRLLSLVKHVSDKSYKKRINFLEVILEKHTLCGLLAKKESTGKRKPGKRKITEKK